MASSSDGSIKYKAITGRLIDYFGFKLNEDGSISSVGNVCCMTCGKTFAYHGSNTSLIYHLQHTHPAQHQKALDKGSSKKPALSSSSRQINNFFRASERPVSVQLQSDINTSLANWIATAGRPISIVEDKGLEQTMRIALQNDSYTLPSRRTIDGVLAKMYDSKLADLKTTLGCSHALAITSDFWTSLGNEAYCGITGHWINADWELSSAVLECRHVVECHFAENVAEVFKNFAADCDITSKVKAVITDNARNMTSAVALTGFPHIPCMAHSLQLSILHGFKVADTDVLFAKCCKVVGHFKHSSANTAELMSCNDSESPLHKLQQDVPTRWNSIFIMIQSLLKAKDAIVEYMTKFGKKYTGPNLLDSDWEKMSKYSEVLQLFCQATVVLGGEKYVSCSSVLPLLSALRKHMTVHDDDPEYIARFKAAALDDFQERVTGMNGVEILRIATALDPRYKTLRCLTPDKQDQTWAVVGRKISVATEQASVVSNDNESDTVHEPMKKRLRLMDSDSDTDDSPETADEELARYKCEKKLPDGEDPLLWWKMNAHRFPRLALLARNVLCVPATSVPCERLFSSAGYIVNKTRSSLDPNTVNLLVCLRDWCH